MEIEISTGFNQTCERACIIRPGPVRPVSLILHQLDFRYHFAKKELWT